MNDKPAESSNRNRDTGPDAVANLIRNAGKMTEPAPAFKVELRNRLAEAWQRQVVVRRRRRRAFLGAAVAAVLAIAVVGLQLFHAGTQAAGSVLRAPPGLQIAYSGEVDRNVQAGARIYTGSRLLTGASPAALELGNGFNVRLDAGTQVTIVNGNRLALDSGRIYVDSGAIADVLVIETPFGAVRDIGTQFAVALDPDQLTVQVRDGLVKVQHATSTIAVEPGQQLQLDAEGDLHREPIALSGGEWLWAESVAPVLIVEGRSVHAFLEAIHRQTGLEIVYATPEVARRASGTVIGGNHPDLPPRQMLDIVMSATDFRHVISGSTITIHGN